MAIEKSPLADVISEHWSSMQGQCVEVPEWKVDGEPTVVYFNPVTLTERDQLRKFQGNESLVEAVILKATDADGNKLFSKADKPQLMNCTSPAVVARIAERILIADVVDVERLGKR